MAEHRVIVDTDISAQQAEALAAMLGRTDERVDALEAINAERTCRLDHGALARLIEGLDAKIEAAVTRAFDSHMEDLASDKNKSLPTVAVRASGHVWSHLRTRFSEWFTSYVFTGLLTVILALCLYIALRLGVIK